MTMRDRIKSMLPGFLLRAFQRQQIKNIRDRFGGMSAQNAFDEIYTTRMWGGAPGEIYSGSGSRGAQAEDYIVRISKLIAEKHIQGIVDIGCGDFFIGGAIMKSAGAGVTYTGADVSTAVVDHNNRVYAQPNISFRQLDAAREALPAGELCLIRQVLQHLSNAEIGAILEKIRQFKWTVITEHYPPDDRIKAFNLDKPHGPDIRILDGSAVFVDKPPFNVAGMELILEIPTDQKDGVLRSFLISN